MVHLADVLVHELPLADIRSAVVPVGVESAAARLHGRHFTCVTVKIGFGELFTRSQLTGVDEELLCPGLEEFGEHGYYANRLPRLGNARTKKGQGCVGRNMRTAGHRSSDSDAQDDAAAGTAC